MSIFIRCFTFEHDKQMKGNGGNEAWIINSNDNNSSNSLPEVYYSTLLHLNDLVSSTIPILEFLELEFCGLCGKKLRCCKKYDSSRERRIELFPFLSDFWSEKFMFRLAIYESFMASSIHKKSKNNILWNIYGIHHNTMELQNTTLICSVANK